MRSTSCRTCEGQWPSEDHRIAESRLTVAFLHDDQVFPGWTRLVLKRHATELFELSRDERSRLMEEISTMAESLAEVFHPVKMNYALLGNHLPHCTGISSRGWPTIPLQQNPSEASRTS